MISSDWRYELIIHVQTGKASLPVLFFVIISWLFSNFYCHMDTGEANTC